MGALTLSDRKELSAQKEPSAKEREPLAQKSPQRKGGIRTQVLLVRVRTTESENIAFGKYTAKC